MYYNITCIKFGITCIKFRITCIKYEEHTVVRKKEKFRLEKMLIFTDDPIKRNYAQTALCHNLYGTDKTKPLAISTLELQLTCTIQSVVHLKPRLIYTHFRRFTFSEETDVGYLFTTWTETQGQTNDGVITRTVTGWKPMFDNSV